jgi:hypothetical protein
MARRPGLIKRKPKTIRVTKSEAYIVNKKHLGDEPIFTDKSTNADYMNGLNWYNYMASNSEAKEYLSDYLKNIGRVAEAKKIKRISDSDIPTTAAWSVRMISRGYKPNEFTRNFIDEKIKAALNKINTEEPTEESNKPVVSIQDRMRERAHDILGEIEGMIDDYIYDNVEFSLYEWLQANNIPAAYATSIIAKMTPVLDELLEAYEGKCEQLKEGYRHYKKADIKRLVSFYNTLIEDAERYSSNTKKVNKARKPRTISVEKKIKNLKYQKEDATYKIASVSPEKIIGALELWTFNTKYKTITRLTAIDRGGLQVKGTSITNFDESSSVTMSVGRKDPNEFLKRILEGGKLVLRKVFDEIKTQKPLAYRINENTILLRVVT